MDSFFNSNANYYSTYSLNFLSSKKAQASAPFELLVAIIIMGFVIIAGSNVLNEANSKSCIATASNEIDNLKKAIEDSTLRQSPTEIYFNPDKGGCFNATTTTTKINSFNSATAPKECSLKCGISSNACFTISFQDTKKPGSFIERCLNIPSYTHFYSTDITEENCPTTLESSYAGWLPAMPSQLKVGRYAFKNVSKVGAAFPNVCIYYKRN